MALVHSTCRCSNCFENVGEEVQTRSGGGALWIFRRKKDNTESAKGGSQDGGLVHEVVQHDSSVWSRSNRGVLGWTGASWRISPEPLHVCHGDGQMRSDTSLWIIIFVEDIEIWVCRVEPKRMNVKQEEAWGWEVWRSNYKRFDCINNFIFVQIPNHHLNSTSGNSFPLICKVERLAIGL